MIQAENLTKFYGPIQAISNVSFSIAKGEILGFLGPNGAGKSTTMRILGCFMPPSSGNATIAGYDIEENSLEVRKRLGYLPESTPLYTHYSTIDYLRFVAGVKGVPAKERNKQIERILGECGLHGVSGKIIQTLSKGYKQRVGIAQALINDPPILILDEPTAGLDPKQIIEIRDLIKNLAGYRTIILSTHILPEVSVTCNRVVIINEGTIIAEDTPENLNAQLQKDTHISIQVEGPSDKISKQLQKVEGIVSVKERESSGNSIAGFMIESKPGLDLRQTIAKKIVENGWGLMEMKLIKMTLEDIFIKLVTSESKDGD